MIPKFQRHDLRMFNKAIRKCEYYFEFGSGGSTFQAAMRKNIKKIYSVESNEFWIKRISDNIAKVNSKFNKKIEFKFIDFIGKRSLGYPSEDCPKEVWYKYSQALNDIEIPPNSVILVDGRFRVACLLNIFNNIKDDTIILFDDFLLRQDDYKDILKNFEIIESGNAMVKLKKKKNNLYYSLLLKNQDNPL